MAYFLGNFQGFPLLWTASAKLLRKVAVSILSMGFFAIFLFLLCVGALHLGQLLKKLQFPCFSHCSKASFLWFHCVKGTKPSFFRPLPRFPAEFEHVTTYKQMTHGLFSLQFSRFSFALGGFCHFLPFNGFLCNFQNFPVLWAASAKNCEKVVISRFPSDFEHATTKSTWHMAYFLWNFQGFRLIWTASAKMLIKLQFPCLSHCRTASLLWFHCAKGTKPSFFRPLPRFPAEFEHVTTYKQMAYGLFSLQFSKFSFALGGFC